MQLACQCICAWSQTWNPTSADRLLLPPLSSWEQLLILLPAGLVSQLLVGSVFPSALLWPVPPAAAGSGSAPGCEQAGAAQATAGGRQWNEGRRSLVQKAFSFASRQGNGAGNTILHTGDKSHNLLPLLRKRKEEWECICVLCILPGNTFITR